MGQKCKIQEWWTTFAVEYQTNGQNGTLAYQKARPGVNYKSASVNAKRLLDNAKFKEFYSTFAKKAEVRNNMSFDRWLGMLVDIAGFDVRNFLVTDELTGDVKLASDWRDRVDGHAIESINFRTTTLESGMVVQRVEMKRDNKIKALELLGKALGYLKDRVEVSGSISQTLLDCRRQISCVNEPENEDL